MPYTDDEIRDIVTEFVNTVGYRQYQGARYVPIFGRKDEETIEWDGGAAPYEPLTIVTHMGSSYTSRQDVPAGVDIYNKLYWAETGNYNSQIEEYKKAIMLKIKQIDVNTQAIADERVARQNADAELAENIENTAAELTEAIDSAKTELQENINSVSNNLTEAINAEIDTRTESDNAITENLNIEIENRISADSALGLLINANSNAINALNDDVDDIEEEISDLPAIRKRLLVKSYYIVPNYEGSFTAYNGYLKEASKSDGPDPMYGQGMCWTSDGKFRFFTGNGDYSRQGVWTGDILNNTIRNDYNSYTAFGHANSVDYDPELHRYYISTGSSIVIADDSLNVIDTVMFPVGSPWGSILYDKETGNTYGVNYDGYIYTFDTSNNTLQPVGYTIDNIICNQGMALYGNVLACLYDGGGDQRDYRLAINCYDIRDGSHIGSFAMPENTAYYPIGETEDLTFSPDGRLYMSSMLRYEGSLNYCATNVLFSMDIFNGSMAVAKTFNYTQPPTIYVECSNYSGFYSIGSYNYPLKSLDELTHLLRAMPKTRIIKMGLESAHSNNNAQTWFGFIQITGVNCTIHWNGSNNITMQGGIIARDNCILKTRNRTTIKPWFHQTNQAMIRADDSILQMSSVVVVQNSVEHATTVGAVFYMPGTGFAWINSITKYDNDIPDFSDHPNGGMGYVIGAAKTGSL